MTNMFAPKGRVKQVSGSITQPENAGLRLVFVPFDMSGKVTESNKLANVLAKRWSRVIAEYKGWFGSRANFKLGEINSISVQSDIWIVQGLCLDDKGVNKVALEACTKKLLALLKYEKASLHISNLLTETLPEFVELVDKVSNDGVSVYCYKD